MLDPKNLDDIARRFTDNLPGPLRDMQQEVEKNARIALQSAFARMDLITREEFDAQSKVLARTRERLEALEQQVEALERNLKTSGPAKSGTQSKAKSKPAPDEGGSAG